MNEPDLRDVSLFNAYDRLRKAGLARKEGK